MAPAHSSFAHSKTSGFGRDERALKRGIVRDLAHKNDVLRHHFSVMVHKQANFDIEQSLLKVEATRAYQRVADHLEPFVVR